MELKNILLPTKARIATWVNERFHLDRLTGFLSAKTVPNHKYTFWYLFGGTTLFLFLTQIISGLLLLLYYKPTPETAYESVRHIIEEVPFGSAVRSLHIWSSHLLIVSILIHMFSTYFMKAYRKPREGMWLSGVVLLFVMLAFGFTGYLLPWDTTAFLATQIGTEIPRSIPIVGGFFVTLLRGGSEVNGDTLTRLFALHVAILPLVAVLIIGAHIMLNQLLGTSRPIGIQDTGKLIPFYPDFLRRDWLSWLVIASVMVALVMVAPWSLGEKANPFASAPQGVKPEWYFWPLYQSLNLLPARILGVPGEVLTNLAVVFGGLFWWLIPFLDRRAKGGLDSRGFTYVGIVVLAYLLGMVIWVLVD